MTSDRANSDPILAELLQRVASLEAKVKSIDSRLSNVENKIDKVMEMLVTQKNGIVRFIVGTFVAIIVIILSFIAALFGLGWEPPTP